MKTLVMTLITGALIVSMHTDLSAQRRRQQPLVVPDNVTVEEDTVYLEAGDYLANQERLE